MHFIFLKGIDLFLLSMKYNYRVSSIQLKGHLSPFHYQTSNPLFCDQLRHPNRSFGLFHRSLSHLGMYQVCFGRMEIAIYYQPPMFLCIQSDFLHLKINDVEM